MKRVITALVILAVFLPILIFANIEIFSVAVAILGAIAAFEVLQIKGLHKRLSVLIPSIIFTVAFPIVSGTPWLSMFKARSYNFLVVAFPCYLFYLLFVAIIHNKKFSLADCAYAYMTVSVVALASFSMPFLRLRCPLPYLLLIACPCFTDIFALYGGSLFGKHKLCEAISPKKTVEGAIAGVVGSVACALIYGLIKNNLTDNSTSYLFLVLAGIGISVVGQFGDLAASLVKRHCGVKDFGTVFPGHGGVLDRFDSIYAAFATAFVFLTVYYKIISLI